MIFNFISIFPELITSGLSQGVVGQALKKNKIKFHCVNPREFALDLHKTVDDRPFGGFDGMTMLADVLDKSLNFISESRPHLRHKILYLSPQGRTFNHRLIKDYLDFEQITFICGRYAGIDQRLILEHSIEEISLGDFVVSGGELPALLIMDAIARQIPGVLGNDDSRLKDSFVDALLEAPVFTRPQTWKNWSVPEVLVSGNHMRINEWHEILSWLITMKKRPDLLKDRKVPIHQMKAYYLKMSEKEKIVCGVENMLSLLENYIQKNNSDY